MLDAFLRVLVAMGSSGSILMCRDSIIHAFLSQRVFNAERYCLRWMTNRYSRSLLVESAKMRFIVS